MQEYKKKLAIIIVLLIAVIAVSLGVMKMHDARKGDTAGGTTDAVSGQTDGESNEESGEDSADKSGEEASAPVATLFFASDYQAEPDFDAPADTLRGLLEAAKADGKKIDRIVICGDYTNDAVLHDYQLSPDDSIAEIREIADDECPGAGSGEGDAGSDGRERVLFVQGNHDRLTDQITPSGLYEYDDCLIYVLNTEEDFPWKQGKKSGCLAKVNRSSEAMKECFDKLIENGETRPVFIAGHVPLHFTARTSSRHTTGDNLYSSLIFNVVNEAAESLDIVYLFGHNHSKGWDCYMGGSSVYKAKGDTILIPYFTKYMVDTDEYTEETLRFTYLNAGYTGYYMNCAPAEYTNGGEGFHAADETLTGTVFEIYPDRIVATRYDTGGVHVLGHEGDGDPYKGGIDAGLIPEDKYSKETKSPFTIKRVLDKL